MLQNEEVGNDLITYYGRNDMVLTGEFLSTRK